MKTIVDIADGASALLINSIYNVATGGDFWESGGQISEAGSSTGIQLSVSAATVNIGGETITHGSQPVTLSATSGEYRSDIVYADSTGIGVVEGVEMAKLPQYNRFPSIWQPAPDNGSLVPGVPLWVVHVTPEDAASGDIASWQFQDHRLNASSLSPAEVATLLGNYDTSNGAVDTTVTNAQKLSGMGGDTRAASYGPTMFFETVPKQSPGSNHSFYVPASHEVHIFKWSVAASTGATGTNQRIQFGRYNLTEDKFVAEVSDVDGTNAVNQTFQSRGEPFAFRLDNQSQYEVSMTGTVWWGMTPAGTH